jgi:hypothetical protein
MLWIALAGLLAGAESPPPPPLPPLECVDETSGAVLVSAAEIVPSEALAERPTVVHRVEPTWPAGSRRLEPLVFELVIDRDGAACALRVLRGRDPEVVAAATAALRQWRWTPGRQGEALVPVRLHLSVLLHPER